jgi:hypothetical protein
VGGDGLGAPDTISECVAQKTGLRDAVGNVFWSGAFKSFGKRFGGRGGDALIEQLGNEVFGASPGWRIRTRMITPG